MKSGVKILGILVMVLLLQSTMVTCLAEQRPPPKIPVRVKGPTASGDVRLKMYPDGWIKVSGHISTFSKRTEKPAVAVPYHATYQCRYEPISEDRVLMKRHGVIGPEPGALESIPEGFRGRLGELKFSMSYAEKFTRSGPTYNGVFIIFLPEAFHVKGSLRRSTA